LVDVFERALLFGELVDSGGDLELDEGDVELRVEVCRSGRECLLRVVKSSAESGDAVFMLGSKIPGSS